MGLEGSAFDNWCKDKLKIKGSTAILIFVLVLICLVAIAIVVGVVVYKKTNRESYTTAKIEKDLESELQKYINSWNNSVDTFYGIKKSEGYRVKKPSSAENYERSRAMNNFSYLKEKPKMD